MYLWNMVIISDNMVNTINAYDKYELDVATVRCGTVHNKSFAIE